MTSENVIVRAFTIEQAARLTGITVGRLRYWDTPPRFFSPEYADENRRAPFSRIYSFQDVVALRVINVLQTQYGISLQHLRKVRDELQARSGAVWARTKLYVVKKEVVFDDPETDKPRGVVSGQYVTPSIIVENVIGDVEADSREAFKRDPKTIGQITRNRFIAHNQWIIEGTRIPVSAVKAFHDEGYSVPEIIKQYPTLTEEDVRAAIEYEATAA